MKSLGSKLFSGPEIGPKRRYPEKEAKEIDDTKTQVTLDARYQIWYQE